MISEIREEKERWIIMTIYYRWDWKDLERTLERVLGEIENRKECMVILRGDFNIRTGELGSVSEVGVERRSKDKIVGNGDRNMIRWIEEKG